MASILGGDFMYRMFICTQDKKYYRYRYVQISDYYYALLSRSTDPHGRNITVILFAFALQFTITIQTWFSETNITMIIYIYIFLMILLLYAM